MQRAKCVSKESLNNEIILNYENINQAMRKDTFKIHFFIEHQINLQTIFSLISIILSYWIKTEFLYK